MRIILPSSRFVRLAAVCLAASTSGCHFLPGGGEAERTVFPDLRDVPEPPKDKVTPKERSDLLKELESEREGVPPPRAPGDSTPAVPPKERTSALDAAIAATAEGKGGIAWKNRLVPPPAPHWQELAGLLSPPPVGEGVHAILAAARIPEVGEPASVFPSFRGTLSSEAPRTAAGVTGSLALPPIASLLVGFRPGTDEMLGAPGGDFQRLAAALLGRPSARLEVYASGPTSQALPEASDRLGAFSIGLKRATAVTTALIAAGAPADRVVLVTGHDSTRFTDLAPFERAALAESAIVRFAERER